MSARRSAEQLRQERETFDQARAHDRLWFTLSLAIGYVAIVLMIGVAAVAAWVVLHPERYEPEVLAVAAATLLVDLVSLVATVFRLVLQPGSARPLQPVTRSDT
ncbi:hypothetical protein D3C73_34370 [compost metagenome]